MTQIIMVKGDANFNLKFTIYDLDDTIVDLSHSIPTLNIQEYEKDTIAVSYTGTSINVGGGGHCTIPINTVTLDPGEYFAEIEIAYKDGTGKILTCPDIEIIIKAQLPKS